MQNYERELEKFVANELDKPSSVPKTEGAKASALPPWLQNAKAQDEDAKKHETTSVSSTPILGLLICLSRFDSNHYWKSAFVK